MSKNKYVKFRVSEDELDNLFTNAAINNLSLSEYIRLRMNLPLKKDYRLLLFHISRIGNNINQLAKAMNIAQKIAKLEKSQLQTALTRLLCIQAELEQLRIDFKAGELNNVNQGK